LGHSGLCCGSIAQIEIIFGSENIVDLLVDLILEDGKWFYDGNVMKNGLSLFDLATQ